MKGVQTDTNLIKLFYYATKIIQYFLLNLLYIKTHKYQKNDDNLHSKINDYIKNSPYKIYLSSYEWNGLAVVKEFSHRSTLSATANNKVVERLFCNQNEIVKNTLF
jgi:hypothetical protein